MKPKKLMYVSPKFHKEIKKLAAENQTSIIDMTERFFKEDELEISKDWKKKNKRSDFEI